MLVALLLVLLSAGVSLALFAWWIVGLVDVARRDDHELQAGTVTVWIVVMLVTGVIGTAAYWYVARPPAGQ